MPFWHSTIGLFYIGWIAAPSRVAGRGPIPPNPSRKNWQSKIFARLRADGQNDSKKEPRLNEEPGFKLIPATSYSPMPFWHSTIGPEGLNCRVRNGNGWDPLGMVTGKFSSENFPKNEKRERIDENFVIRNSFFVYRELHFKDHQHKEQLSIQKTMTDANWQFVIETAGKGFVG